MKHTSSRGPRRARMAGTLRTRLLLDDGPPDAHRGDWGAARVSATYGGTP